ncbi:MAG: ATP synthase F0 subunit B [Bdellovibrionota bacterium]
MNKRKLFSILAVAGAYVPAAVLAEAVTHAEHEAPGIGSLAWPTVNFAIYFGIVVYLYRRFGRPALVARTAGFEAHFIKAAQVLDQAERELATYENRLRTIVDEQQAIRERLATEGAQIAEQIMVQAEESAAALTRDTSRRIERELSTARSEVRQQAIRRATELALQQLQKGLSADDDFRLRQEALRGLN